MKKRINPISYLGWLGIVGVIGINTGDFMLQFSLLTLMMDYSVHFLNDLLFLFSLQLIEPTPFDSSYFVL